MKKYGFTKKVKIEFGITLRQIKAIVAFRCIKKGQIGGWIENKKNLDQYGDAWVYGDARVYGNAQVYGDAQVSGNAWVYGDAQVSGNAQVYGDARVSGNAQVYGDARVYGNAQVSGNAWVYGDARVSGDAWVYGWITGKIQITPPFFKGSRYEIGFTAPGLIKSGCITKPIQWWINNIKRCAEEHGYTEIQLKEYELYIDLLAKWMKLYGLDKEENDGSQT